MPNTTSQARRWNVPLMLAAAGLIGWYARPGSAISALALLFCPGWGLARILTGIRRRFGVLATSLCLSVLVLGLIACSGLVSPDKFGLAAHIAGLGSCLVGGILLARRHREQAALPEPPPPWPARTPTCLVVVLAAVLATVWADPPEAPAAGSSRVIEASRALAWQTDGQDPFLAGRPLSRATLLPAAAATLSSGTGLHPLVTVSLVVLSALVATLLFLAEGAARLWGNRGGARALLAMLLGLNPLAVFFLLGSGGPDLRPAAMSPDFDPAFTVALGPFLDGSSLALALAFVSMLLASTLSVLRRASLDVPRLAAAAMLGLVLSVPVAAVLLLPGWLAGIAWAHFACRDSPDNDPLAANPTRMAWEPRALRAPFWRLALPIAGGLLAGLALGAAPSWSLSPSRSAAWGLLAAVGPSCLLFLPGVRHLNATPGREAFFFAGLILVTAALGITTSFPDDQGMLVVRLMALLLSVPCAIGAIKMVDIHGRRARLILLALVLALLPASIWLVRQVRRVPRSLHVDAAGNLMAPGLSLGVQALLQTLHDASAPNAALAVLGVLDTNALVQATLLAQRPLVHMPLPSWRTTPSHRALLESTERAAQLDKLRSGLGAPLVALRGRPGLEQREIWGLHRGDPWRGFETVAVSGEMLLQRARVPDILVVTVSCLRDDRIDPSRAPQLAALASRGVRFGQAVSPLPDTVPGLLTLLSGLSPADHRIRTPRDLVPNDLPTLSRSLDGRGYRTAAVVALGADWLRDFLPTQFDHVYADPAADAEALVDEALVQLAAADPRPLFLWLHLSDLVLPYDPPAELRNEATGGLPFPVDPDLDRTQFGVAAFPPAPTQGLNAPEVDVAGGVAQYDALVRLVDTALGRLAASVSTEGVLVVTAPHGTALDEHEAWFDAGRDLFEPSIRVPLIVTGGGMPIRAEPGLTSLADLADLLLYGRQLYGDRAEVLLESRERPGLGTGRAFPPDIDPTSRGAARVIWGVRTLQEKTLLTREPADGRPAGGVRYRLDTDPAEMDPLPADPQVLEELLRWRSRADG